MIGGERRRRLARAGIGLAIPLAVALAVAPAFAAAGDDGDDGFGLSVTVTGEPVPPGSGGTPGGGSTGGTRGGSSGGSVPVVELPTEPVPDEEPVDAITGGLSVSGLGNAYGWSVNPFSGSVIASFTIRNGTDAAITADAKLWLDGPFGNRLSTTTPIKIALEPGDSKIITTELGGVGQWSVVHANLLLTPTGDVADDSSPVSRDAYLFVAPWLVISGLLLGGIAWFVVWRVRASLGLLAGAPA